MKKISIVLLKQFIATLVVFIIHAIILRYFSLIQMPVLSKVYTINFTITAICLILLYIIHQKTPEFVGFSYLFLVLFKMAVVVAILYKVKDYQKNIIDFMISYMMSLFIEVYLAVNQIFKNDK